MPNLPIVIPNTTIGASQVNAVSARDLHEKLDVKSKIADWIKRRILESLLVEGEDYICFSSVGSKTGRGGSNRKDYYLTLDAAKHISMLEKTDAGKAIRQYFIDVEKAAQEAAKIDPALQAQIDQASGMLSSALHGAKVLRPAAELGNTLTKGRTIWPMNTAAKELGVNCEALRATMRKFDYMEWYEGRCLPTDLGEIKGLFDKISYPFGFTLKGLQVAYGLLIANGYEPKEVTA